METAVAGVTWRIKEWRRPVSRGRVHGGGEQSRSRLQSGRRSVGLGKGNDDVTVD
jgi:hypothetical protein